MNIAIWGTGEVAQRNITNIDGRIVGFIDNYIRMREFCGKKVYTPIQFVESGVEYDYLVVLTDYSEEIYKQCIRLGIESSKIILYKNYKTVIRSEKINSDQVDCVRTVFPKLNDVIEENYRKVEESYKDAVICNNCMFDKVQGSEMNAADDVRREMYQKDYFRYRTFELCANEINRRKLEGAVAEVGVFRGDFAALINAKFLDRKLYLFDTFSSFDKSEFDREIALGRWDENAYKIFENTSTDLVLSKMKNRDNCIIKQGFFPESVIEEDIREKFVFVSLDVDLEESTYKALRWIYPRMASGGYIFIHDYNTCGLEGIKVALERYEKDTGTQLIRVPLADWGGTVVIIKP